MQRIENKVNTNTIEFWNAYYQSIDTEDDRLIIYKQLAYILKYISFHTVLEIGCGTGIGAEYIKSKFDCIYTASDFSKVAIDKATDKADAVQLLDINKSNPLTKYDVIVIAETLEHLEDPYSVIDKCLKYCNYLVLSLPLNESEECDSEHIWCKIKPEDFSRYNVHIIQINESYFQIILR